MSSDVCHECGQHKPKPQKLRPCDSCGQPTNLRCQERSGLFCGSPLCEACDHVPHWMGGYEHVAKGRSSYVAAQGPID